MKRTHAMGLLAGAFGALAVLYACSSNDTSNSTTPPGTDAGTTIPPNDSGTITPTNDASPPPGDSGPQTTCFSGTPTTYLEIINACTDAEAIDKTVDLSPMNLADGGLQPLP
jgi:hypothetical protein